MHQSNFFFGLVISIFRSCLQQVPEEIERVMVGVEAYLSIRKHVSDTGLSFFEDDDDSAKESTDKVFDPNMPFSLKLKSHLLPFLMLSILVI